MKRNEKIVGAIGIAMIFLQRRKAASGDCNSAAESCAPELLFDHGAAEVTPIMRAKISASARCMKKRNVLGVHAIGHASDSGTESFNLELARRRAENVARAYESFLPSADVGFESRGEADAIPSDPAYSRRVDVAYWSQP